METIFKKYNKIPKKYKYLLDFYVINHNFNTGKIKKFNIFDNIKVSIYAYDAIKEYQKTKDIKNFKEHLDAAVRYEEQYRCEYEILAGGLFSDPDKFIKIDCYSQFRPNLDIFVDYLIKNIEV